MGVPLYDYRRWPNFSRKELACRHTNLENPNVEEFAYLMNWVQHWRTLLDIPFTVTSAYRHPSHPDEKDKLQLGQHTIAAIDLQVAPEHVHKLVTMAFEAGCKGMGWKLHGAYNKRFIHIDFRKGPSVIWSYK